MLEKNGKLALSAHSDLYDILIEKDNELRRLLELVDFSFIYDELKGKYCQDNGRNAVDPVVMFKYLLLKTMYGLSDRNLIKRCRYDILSFSNFCTKNS